MDDVEKTELEGLKDCAYTDSTAGGQHKTEQATHLRIQGEVDRNYLHTPAELRLHEGARTLHISQEGFGDTVVWNPGAALAARMSDLAADEYRHFLCVEAAAIAQPIVLAPGARWRGSQTLSV